MITRDRWLAALAEAQREARKSDPEALTYAEYGNLIGVHPSTAKKHLRMLLAQGRATVTQKWIERADGSAIRVPAYKLVQS